MVNMTTELMEHPVKKEVVTAYPVTMADDIPEEPGIRELKARLSDYVGRTIHRDEPVFVTRNGKRVIALVPAEWAERMLAERSSGETGDKA
jgi:prevent-host-death family protein